MRFLITLAAGLLAATAFAQDEGVAPDPEDAAAPDEELSELERLSRTADDPFEGVIRQNERQPVSVTLRALDKITARYTDIEIPMHQIAHFGSLDIQPRYCDKRPPEEFPETTAFLEIFDTEFGSRESDLKIREPEILEEKIEARDLESIPVESFGAAPVETAPGATRLEQRLLEPAPEVLSGPKAEGVNIFRGWMFASSPALNALEHPVYDVWVIDCKTRIAGN